MFKPDIDLAALTSHISYMFHVVIGLDPLGDFSSVRGLNYEVEPFRYNELGRNHSPVTLPFNDGPGAPGEMTLQWGMVVRSLLFEWMHSVKAGGDFRKNVHIFQLSQQRLPLRLYQLTGAWPKSWETSEMTTERAEWSTEELVLVYDQIDMLNLSAIAMAGALLGSPVNAAVENVRPPGFRPRESGSALRSSVSVDSGQAARRKVIYTSGRPELEVQPEEVDAKVAYVADARDSVSDDGLDRQYVGLAEEIVDAAAEKRTMEDYGLDPNDPEDQKRFNEIMAELQAEAEAAREEDAAGEDTIEQVNEDAGDAEGKDTLEQENEHAGDAEGKDTLEQENEDGERDAEGEDNIEQENEDGDRDAEGKESEEQKNEDGDRDAEGKEERTDGEDSASGRDE